MEQHPLRQFRSERQVSLATAAAVLGTSKANLSRIENGVHGASDALKRRIAEWTGGQVTPNDLVNYPAPEGADAG